MADDRGSAKHLAGGQLRAAVSTHRQTKAAQDTTIALVAGRCLLALLASGLGSSVGAPSRNLDISKPLGGFLQAPGRSPSGSSISTSTDSSTDSSTNTDSSTTTS
jgi:hypothetical protein